jgi:hypothetical protein
VGEHESRGRGGKFERGDGGIKLEVGGWVVGSGVSPSVVGSVSKRDRFYYGYCEYDYGDCDDDYIFYKDSLDCTSPPLAMQLDRGAKQRS